MPVYKQTVSHHEQQSVEDVACLHCERVTRHEHRCITQNAKVLDAFQVSVYPHLLTLQESPILCALGVSVERHK